MKILAIRTDKEEAELYIYEGHQQLAAVKWLAHRQLAETVHKQIAEILNKSSISIEDLNGVLCFAGPGSFTGLRIGLSVGNALAYSQSIPIVVAKGNDWLEEGIERLIKGKNDRIALPEYGAPAKTTRPKM